MNDLLKVNNVTAGYGVITVLKDVSITLGKNERVALIGPNAAGKTTMFKTIMGMLKPKSGTVELEGERIDSMNTNKILEKGLALVPEGRMIFPDMNVYDNIELGAYIHGGVKNVSDTLEWVFQLFPILKDRKDQMGGSLSGGEQQMLAIGRALMANPKLMILDEPSLGLAPMLVQQIRDIIVEINEQGTSVLLIEQNARMALSIANYGYIMETGKVVMDGDPSKLLGDEDVQEFYLGLHGEGGRKSFRDVKHYKRRKRWLS